MTKKSEVKEIKEALKTPTPDNERVEFISTGSTMINLALSGRARDGGWGRGRIGNVVGDGSTGKSLLMLETMAWVYYNIRKISSKIYSSVIKVSLVYDNNEQVMDFPIAKMYGEEFVGNVEWIHSGTIEAMGREYTRRVKSLKEGEFLLYVVDSWDSLDSEAGLERFEEAAAKNKSEDGSYRIEKPKYASDFFRHMCGLSEGKDTTLLIVSQVRDRIGVTFGRKHYRTGGKALDFYTHQILWLAEESKLKKTFHGEERAYGIRVRGKVDRNKTWKSFREANFTILFDYGLDDIASMIDWYYGPEVKKVEFDGQFFDRKDVISYVEKNNLQDMLIDLCQEEWDNIERSIAPERKKRFGEE